MILLATSLRSYYRPMAQAIVAETCTATSFYHAEYPRTAEIEQRCIRMLANLFNAPGETTGSRHARLLRGDHAWRLSLKWNWRKRREA